MDPALDEAVAGSKPQHDSQQRQPTDPLASQLFGQGGQSYRQLILPGRNLDLDQPITGRCSNHGVVWLGETVLIAQFGTSGQVAVEYLF